MEYYFYFNLALLIGSIIAIIYGFCYLILEDMTDGEFAINLILFIHFFLPLFLSAYNLWNMKQ